MAESLDHVATKLEDAMKRKKPLDAAIKELLQSLVKENRRIIFNGNGYSDEWRRDAKKRGLLNLTNTVDALPELVKPEVMRIFEKYKVLNAREIRARYEVNVETYCKTVNVEAQLMVLMANRYILPAALRYQKDIAESVAAVRDAGGSAREAAKMLDRVATLVDAFRVRTDRLAKALEHHTPDTYKHAVYMRDEVVPAMNALRETGDQIELLVPHEIWPLPTYREMLFIK
jgi:glutamine synthetase